jgi:hypothetical protein
MMVNPRTLVLAAASVVVLGFGVYLFVEVRSAPAQPQSAPPQDKPRALEHVDKPPVIETASADPRVRAGGSAFQVRPARPEAPRPNPLDQPVPPAIDEHANPRLDSIMDEATKAYDTGDFEQARAIASKVLARTPTNVRMLRIMVSSSCIEGDAQTAQQYYNYLPAWDRQQMRVRCADKSGITFVEPQQQAAPMQQQQ